MGDYSTKILEQRCMGLETLFSNLQVEYKKLEAENKKLKKEIANGKPKTSPKPRKR